jgi:hypothetical protein
LSGAIKITTCTETVYFCSDRYSSRWSVKNDKGKLYADSDRIPNYIIEKCIESTKKPFS